MGQIGEVFARLAPAIIVEFVPKDDPMVGKLLATREDVFPDYALDGFRRAMSERFTIEDEAPITGTSRVLLRLSRRRSAA
jgi:hypothetical protein